MYVRKLNESDLNLRVTWMNHPKVYSSMHLNLPVSLENTLKWYHLNVNNNARIDLVFEDIEDQPIAMGGLTSIDPFIRKAELYIFVNPDSQAKGIGTRVTSLLCKYAFEILSLHKVYLYTNETNIAAQRIYEKNGFKLEGRLRDELYVNERYETRLYYGLLFKDFKALESQLIFVG